MQLLATCTPKFVICSRLYSQLLIILFYMQSRRGFLFARVDGKIHDFIVSTKGDVWRKRRRILTPAFSAHKMKLVGEVAQYKGRFCTPDTCNASQQKHDANPIYLYGCNIFFYFCASFYNIIFIFMLLPIRIRIRIVNTTCCTCIAPYCFVIWCMTL